MKLLMLEHPEHGVWYFTTNNKGAKYIGTSMSNLMLMLKGYCKQCKGWKGQWIMSDDILSKYINPER